MQVMYTFVDGLLNKLELPDPKSCVLPQIEWGAFDELRTPAYWAGQAWQHSLLQTFDQLSLGRTLAEELAACLLGGFGMPAEVGLCAYSRIRERGLLEGIPSARDLELSLSEPMVINGRRWTYRFPRQKSKYLASALQGLQDIDQSDGDIGFRNQLTNLPGIGLKTASWIVRNIRNSDEVAIIDIHILRACREMRLFDEKLTPERNYLQLEGCFLLFADAIGAKPSSLDGLMWSYMRSIISTNPQMALF